MPQTLDQKRAEYAWEQVNKAVEQKIIADYTREAKGASALIMGNGLMQTLAFLTAKGKPQHKALCDHLCRWLGRTLGGMPVTDQERFPQERYASYQDVMKALHAGPSSLYLRATDEAMALLRWLRQFADACNKAGKE